MTVCSNPDEWAYERPRTKPLLVIEVADFSLDFDQGEKATLYADAGVPEYWVVNLVERVLVVFRDPGKGSYPVRFSLEEKSRVTPEAWPELAFGVSLFLPPASSDETRYPLDLSRGFCVWRAGVWPSKSADRASPP